MPEEDLSSWYDFAGKWEFSPQWRVVRSVERSSFLSIEMLACIVFVLITMPRNVRQVVGPSTLDVLTGILRCWQSESMAAKLPEHSQDCSAPAVKNHQDNEEGGIHRIYAVVSSVAQLQTGWKGKGPNVTQREDRCLWSTFPSSRCQGLLGIWGLVWKHSSGLFDHESSSSKLVNYSKGVINCTV